MEDDSAVVISDDELMASDDEFDDDDVLLVSTEQVYGAYGIGAHGRESAPTFQRSPSRKETGELSSQVSLITTLVLHNSLSVLDDDLHFRGGP